VVVKGPNHSLTSDVKSLSGTNHKIRCPLLELVASNFGNESGDLILSKKIKARSIGMG
jgi:hypothetical protein